MPNWCEGSLRIRGKYDDVIKFFKEGINAYTFDTKSPNGEKVDRDKWFELVKESDAHSYIYFDNVNGNHRCVYIENTRRAFIDEAYDISILTHNEVTTTACAIKQAWGFEPDDWLEISNKYHLELKLFGIECGMGFYEEMYIKDGEIISDTSYAPANGLYDDFIWNCPFPWMGG